MAKVFASLNLYVLICNKSCLFTSNFLINNYFWLLKWTLIFWIALRKRLYTYSSATVDLQNLFLLVLTDRFIYLAEVQLGYREIIITILDVADFALASDLMLPQLLQVCNVVRLEIAGGVIKVVLARIIVVIFPFHIQTLVA